MSLPTASQNTQYFLQAGYGLACAVASAEMALFVEAFAEASSFAVQSIGGVIFCSSIHLGKCFLQFNPLGVLSFVVRSFVGTDFAV
jgi:hypothetical protein